MNATVVTRTRATFADLLAMAPTEALYEVLGGELVVFAAPNGPHAATVIGLVGLLVRAQWAGFGQVRTAPCAVAFDFAAHGLAASDVPQPDVLFLREERRHLLGQQCVEGAPDLVIEVVSPSTKADDLPGGRKWAIYERYSVPSYWLVDPEAQTVTQYTWQDGRFGEPLVLRPGDTLESPLFPGVTCDVAALFAGAS